jgi:hypothetical protein
MRLQHLGAKSLFKIRWKKRVREINMLGLDREIEFCDFYAMECNMRNRSKVNQTSTHQIDWFLHTNVCKPMNGMSNGGLSILLMIIPRWLKSPSWTKSQRFQVSSRNSKHLLKNLGSQWKSYGLYVGVCRTLKRNWDCLAHDNSLYSKS